MRPAEYQADDEPEWADFGEDESLRFLDDEMEYEHPAVLDEVAEAGGKVSFLILLEMAFC